MKDIKEGFYYLTDSNGGEKCVVKVYTYRDVKGVGWGIWDGSAFLPLSDIPGDSVFTLLDIQT